MPFEGIIFEFKKNRIVTLIRYHRGLDPEITRDPLADGCTIQKEAVL
jgi:hypothetical protein